MGGALVSAFEPGKEAPALGRIGDWMQTARGGRMYPLDPRPEEIFLDDIAAALGRICRFGGHLKAAMGTYSVAQHSVLVASLVPPDLRRAALLHDAAEAYVGDMIRPLKITAPLGAAFKVIERGVEKAIAVRFGLSPDDFHRPEVKRADAIVLATERRDVMAPGPSWGALTEAPMADRIVFGWNPDEARGTFLFFARELGLVER